MAAIKRGKSWYGHGLPYVKMKPFPGHLIVIEGTDGVGRSTQIVVTSRNATSRPYSDASVASITSRWTSP